MQFSPPSRHFIPLWSKYPPQHSVLKHPQTTCFGSKAIFKCALCQTSNVNSEALCLHYHGRTVITTSREHLTSVACAVLFVMQESAVATPSAWVLCPSLETSSATDMAAALSASRSGTLSANSSWCDWSASARSAL
jgi:hypothetical protein